MSAPAGPPQGRASQTPERAQPANCAHPLPQEGGGGEGTPVSALDRTPLLTVEDLHTYYGHIHALKGVSFEVRQGEIVTLIGGNGAGKTTTLHTVSRLIKPQRGRVIFDGTDLATALPHEVVARGMAHVPEGRRIFPQLTVRENLEIGAFAVTDKATIEARIARGFDLFPRLKEREKQLGGTLSGGEQQMLAVARALMQEPRLILLDEPSMGLSPLYVETIFDILVSLNEAGKTILLVEQNAHMALGIAHRAYVLQTGQIVREGEAKALAEDPAVKDAYLGE
ncbi:High-affinity branched-chain amino acid transport ATP-binding protein LivF [Burkholderiales bacterium]|nr:MAG: ABC transporter ATP-binding protein [Burkholderiales bacterium]CAG0998927.1 High-affinity branched-chain amino acid transport ATP-binding protein LivF [Burkholderiales bacterium]